MTGAELVKALGLDVDQHVCTKTSSDEAESARARWS